MKTIQLTIDDELLAEVDQATAELHMDRSAFIRHALQRALRQHRIQQLEQQHIKRYQDQPIVLGEFDLGGDA
jgi:metal-responsive CopG/Arc/MetJ family transcriptional regulator